MEHGALQRSFVRRINSNRVTTNQYTTIARNNISEAWSSYPTGFSTQQIITGGPVYCAYIWKYNASYGTALIMSYAQETTPVFCQLYNGVWGSPIALR